mmetsp:Transcript_17151/g.29761  ORF Transcript_17151/g.29761 Transcript_17151/m.29761 type:complete len:292 (+) Transcript_17151:19-894(+)
MTFAKRDRDIGFGADPNNSFWAKDKNKFGLKMLEKMGWSDGKGLGANGTGTTTHIQVKKKVDNAGIGCEKKTHENWLIHQDNFASVLDALNDEFGDGDVNVKNDADSDDKNDKKQKKSKKDKSKKKKSKSKTNDNDDDNSESSTKSSKKSKKLAGSHAKMYHKRAVNKRVQGYSKDDLSSILGCVPASSDATQADFETTQNDDATNNGGGDDDVNVNGEKPNSTLQTRVSTLSVADYFQQKMLALQSSQSNGDTTSITAATTTTTTTTTTVCANVAFVESQPKRIPVSVAS